MEIQKTHRRKKDSALNIFINWLNSKPVGYVYTCAEARKACHRVYSERLGYMHGFLMYSKCVKRIARGKYEILGYIPDFVTQDLLEGTKGYNTYNFITKERSPRGAKWFMGDPNPYEEVCMFEPYTSKSTVNIQTYWKLISSCEHGDFIEVVLNDNTVLKVITILQVTDTPIIKCINVISNNELNIPISNIKCFQINKNSKEFNEENIIEILKQGLSATDAAALIMNLRRN